MDGVKWIKICTDIFEDEKIILIESMPNGDSIFICWQKLLCLAGKQNNSGVFMINGKIPYTAEMLATIIRRPVDLVKQALETFVSLGMLEIVDGVYTIPKWEKHQSIDALEIAREKNRQRVAAFRAKQKKVATSNVTSNATSNVTSNACVMVCNGVDKDIDKDIKEKDILYISKKKSVTSNTNESEIALMEETSETEEQPQKAIKSRKFVSPTLSEIESYARERGREDLAESFFEFYTVNDWHDSNGQAVKNWKQKFITWQLHNEPKKKTLYAPPKVY